MGKDRKPIGALMALAAVALAVSALFATNALAGGKGAGAESPTITVSPNQVPYGATSIVISGSGFRANQGMQVGIWGGIPSYYVETDGNGGFSLTYTPGSGSFDTASPYTAFAAKFKGHRLVTLAEAPFTVCSTNPCQ